ncbi:MAG: carboxypeptidase-like regulatory domain-containing protein [Bacteroidales bacterium]|nr:carboxypeptidase-like regulatory domain-containing protein [Bacteroidales bacterium]
MKTVILILALFSSTLLFSENKNDKNEKESTKQVSGKVTDRLTGENLAGVKIEIPGTDIITYTDFEGNFVLSVSAQNAESEISISFISYESTIVNMNNFSEDHPEIELLPVSR